MPLRPGPAAGAGGCPTAPNPVSSTPTGGLTATRPRQTFEGHRRAVGSCVRELALEIYWRLTARTTAHLARDSLRLMGSLEVREREIQFA